MIDSDEGNKLVIVLTNEADFFKAEYLSNRLLSNRLAACVNFKEIQSYYWWEGKLEKSKEVQLLIKTTKEKLQLLLNFIKVNHSYTTPEILFWIAEASYSYSKWINEVTESRNIY